MKQKKKKLIIFSSLAIAVSASLVVFSSATVSLLNNESHPQIEDSSPTPDSNDNNNANDDLIPTPDSNDNDSSNNNNNSLSTSFFDEAKLSRIIYWNDVVFNSADIEWTDLDKKQPNWNSQTTRTNLQNGLLTVGMKAFASSGLKNQVDETIKNKYMINEGWNFTVILRGNWYQNIKALGIWQAFYEKEDESQNWILGNWLPDFDLKITNSQYPDFVYTHWFRVNKL